MINDLLKSALGDPDILNYRVRRLERGRQTLRAGELVTPSGSYTSVPKDILTASWQISLVGAGTDIKGSVAPTVLEVGIAFTWSTPAIHLYWDGSNGSSRIIIRRQDGTQFAVPGGDIAVGGLATATTYYFLPFWDPKAKSCTLGFVPGTTGTPAIFFTNTTDLDAVQAQFSGTREPLSSGYLSVTTPGTVSGGGGATGSCVMLGTDIEALGECEMTQVLTGQHDWVRLQTEGGFSLNCTPDHPVYTEFGMKQARDVTLHDKLVTTRGLRRVVTAEGFTRVCQKVDVHLSEGHLYWANGILSHNSKVAVT